MYGFISEVIFGSNKHFSNESRTPSTPYSDQLCQKTSGHATFLFLHGVQRQLVDLSSLHIIISCSGSTWILICTELLGRGMDFQGVNLVVNYDFPRSAISYVHRIGRTGRAGRKGEAITFFTEDDTEYLRYLFEVRGSGLALVWYVDLVRVGGPRGFACFRISSIC